MNGYITTDPDSDFQLEVGKRYFMDFDISGIPIDIQRRIPFESTKYHFIEEMRNLGHDPGEVIVSVPAYNVRRITFTANPPPLLIIIAIAISAILIAAGTGAGVFVAFLGLGEAVTGVAELPKTLTKAAVENPIAVVAILVAVGIFILGMRL